MPTPTEIFDSIADTLAGTTRGKMFGALCIKAENGKAGVLLKNDLMVFKLPGAEQEKALKLSGSQVFSPMDGRPMNGWIQVPQEHAKHWKKLAGLAMDYVSQIEVLPKTAKKK